MKAFLPVLMLVDDEIAASDERIAQKREILPRIALTNIIRVEPHGKRLAEAFHGHRTRANSGIGAVSGTIAVRYIETVLFGDRQPIIMPIKRDRNGLPCCRGSSESEGTNGCENGWPNHVASPLVLSVFERSCPNLLKRVS